MNCGLTFGTDRFASNVYGIHAPELPASGFCNKFHYCTSEITQPELPSVQMLVSKFFHTQARVLSDPSRGSIPVGEDTATGGRIRLRILALALSNCRNSRSRGTLNQIPYKSNLHIHTLS